MANIANNTVISCYSDIKDTEGGTILLDKVLGIIRSDKYKKLIERIRSAKDKEERNKLKATLQAVTFAGRFSRRSKAHCAEVSGLICLDYDGLVNAAETKARLSKSKYCFAIFISPSGNGLKMLVRIPMVIGDERYKEYYNAALEHYGNFNPDKSTKDISRLCFLSYDPELFLNENAEVFTKKVIAKSFSPKVRSIRTFGMTNESSRMKGLFNWWKNKHWDSSQRNNSLYKLAATFCEFGISEESAWSVIRTYEESDLKLYELKTLMKSAYKRVMFNSKEFV